MIRMAVPHSERRLTASRNRIDRAAEASKQNSTNRLLSLPNEILCFVGLHCLERHDDRQLYRRQSYDLSMSRVCRRLQEIHREVLYQKIPWLLVRVFGSEDIFGTKLRLKCRPFDDSVASYIRPSLKITLHNDTVHANNDRRKCLVPLHPVFVAQVVSGLTAAKNSWKMDVRLDPTGYSPKILSDASIHLILAHQFNLTGTSGLFEALPSNQLQAFRVSRRFEAMPDHKELVTFARLHINLVSTYPLDRQDYPVVETLLWLNLATSPVREWSARAPYRRSRDSFSPRLRYLYLHIHLVRLSLLTSYMAQPLSIRDRKVISKFWYYRMGAFMRGLVPSDPCMHDDERFLYHKLVGEASLMFFYNEHILSTSTDPSKSAANYKPRKLSTAIKLGSKIVKKIYNGGLDTARKMTVLRMAHRQLLYALQLKKDPHTLALLQHVYNLFSANGEVTLDEVVVFRTRDESHTLTWTGDPKLVMGWREQRCETSFDDGFRHSWPRYTRRDPNDMESLNAALAKRSDALGLLNNAFGEVRLSKTPADVDQLYRRLTDNFLVYREEEIQAQTIFPDIVSDEDCDKPDRDEYFTWQYLRTDSRHERDGWARYKDGADPDIVDFWRLVLDVYDET